MTATGKIAMTAVIATGTPRLVVTALVLLTAVTTIGTMISVMMTGGLVLPRPEERWTTDGPMTIDVTGGTTVATLTTVEMAMEVGTVVVAGRLLQP